MHVYRWLIDDWIINENDAFSCRPSRIAFKSTPLSDLSNKSPVSVWPLDLSAGGFQPDMKLCFLWASAFVRSMHIMVHVIRHRRNIGPCSNIAESSLSRRHYWLLEMPEMWAVHHIMDVKLSTGREQVMPAQSRQQNSALDNPSCYTLSLLKGNVRALKLCARILLMVAM